MDGQIHHEDIIPNRQSLVVFSRRGYIKRMTPDLFSTQVCTSALALHGPLHVVFEACESRQTQGIQWQTAVPLAIRNEAPAGSFRRGRH